ncbi:hypothetical protein L1276_001523 [Flavobacterium sp. HSC-32F16]|uniref:hypothetical protein n=1 Tax=Flavobacterium sp. HSC-32F16 TaxID=2910964 RepID=UPI0020A2D0A4|nr:hypothetical protein [Flavobacterium sp. HSC-32F16]MCP2026379.1 hypothetical protein [Flavobacterium sp. HSC-32F16]
MKTTLKTAAIAFFIMNSQYFFAQQINTEQSAQEIELKNYQNDLKRITADNHKSLDNKISDLKKQLKDFETKKKNLSRSEDNLNTTADKISKLELVNKKIENKITTSITSDEEIQKLRIKIKENEVNIQKLKLTQITQQKELEKAISIL